ncbi:HEAT repeat domain-containing protein [Candidatus Poribacteria bacterium]|nr:HEAT repeat domain-containing protein [Candidatus Poribacteria bacterium]
MADVNSLIEMLKSGDYYSRSTAARKLGEVGGEKAAAALIEALKDEDEWVKEYAAEALGKLEHPPAVAALGELLKSSNYKVRSSTVEALGKIGGEGARTLLEGMKGDSDSWVRDAVTEALKKVSEPKPARTAKPVVAPESGAGSARETEPGLTVNEAPVEHRPHATVPRPGLADKTRQTPEDIVRMVTRRTSISYKPTRSGFLLRVPVGGGRYQRVRLSFDSTDEDGSPLIQVFTVIGPAQPDHYRWALKLNPTFSYGAIGLVKIDDKEFLAIIDTLLEGNVDTKELEKSVRTIAAKGDALEKKLIQKDLW